MSYPFRDKGSCLYTSLARSQAPILRDATRPINSASAAFAGVALATPILSGLPFSSIVLPGSYLFAYLCMGGVRRDKGG